MSNLSAKKPDLQHARLLNACPHLFYAKSDCTLRCEATHSEIHFESFEAFDKIFSELPFCLKKKHQNCPDCQQPYLSRRRKK